MYPLRSPKQLRTNSETPMSKTSSDGRDRFPGNFQNHFSSMDRRRFLELGAIGTGALFTGILGPASCAGLRKNRPDIYFIVIDTLRSDHVGCYGYQRPITPNIDRLAKDSLLFERAYAAAPWTTASVAGMLASQFPSSLGIRDRVVCYDTRYPTLPGVLRDNGYQSHGIVSVDMLSQILGFNTGFDSYDDTNYTGHKGVTSPQVMDKALKLVAAQDQDPLFAFIHTFDPHYNFIQHEKWNFFPEYKGRLSSNYPITKLWEELNNLSEDDVRFLVSAYDSEIAFTDMHLGRFLDGLRDAGRYDDAMIIVTADHGEEFYERKWIGHSITVQREMVQVPLLVKLPGNTAARVSTPVSLLDMMPTVLRYLEMEAPEDQEGFAHDLNAPELIPERPVFSETFHAQRHRSGGNKPTALVGVQLGDHKMIHDAVIGKQKIFNLKTDPGEFKPRKPNGSQQDEELRRLMVDWFNHVNKKMRGAQTANPRDKLTDEQRRRLKSLGYI
jgi:arylsulfatase A-like enzyme